MKNQWKKFISLLIVVFFLNHFQFLPNSENIFNTCKTSAPSKKIALSFDDIAHLSSWNDTISYFDEYGINVTFFIDRSHLLSDADFSLLHNFSTKGHEIGLHTLEHASLTTHLENGGTEKEWFEEQILPALDIMNNASFEINSFAYPFGERNPETDKLVQDVIPVVRGVGGNPIKIHSYHTKCLDKNAYRALNISDRHERLDDVISMFENDFIDPGTLILYGHNINGSGDSISHDNLVKLFEAAKVNNWEFIPMRDLDSSLY